jgi:pimeloyl-ACP methyl ester carboxylesterase
VRRQLEAVLRWSSLRRLRHVRVPTLVIHGDKDRLIPASNGRLIARLIPGARLHILRGAGHVYGTDAPEEHLQLLLGWLAERAAERLLATG